MSEQVEVKPDALPDLDDLLQCPVCYEIPSGQIFQCNEGHHVCGRCKMRLDVCPVCRALFFGTRNYAMEELIANVRKLRAFKLGGKITTDSCPETNTPAKENITEVPENESVGDDGSEQSSQSTQRPPNACKGLFRCLSCKNGNGVRLPAARLLNHLRYFHSPELIEGKSENGEYVQAWQFSTVPGRIVTAVRVSDMGIFFLIIEITNDNVCAWLSMAASPWVAHEFSYTVTISGNDREAIFSDCVWSVRSCEGTLKKRGRCLVVSGIDARALIAPVSISGKLSVRRTPPEQLATQTQPRAVLRVANRVNNRDNSHTHAHDLEPFLQDLQNDVARLSRAFATLGREANALVRSEAEMRARIENRHNTGTNDRTSTSSEGESPPATDNNIIQNENIAALGLSRNARRRMRQRLRNALNAAQAPVPAPRAVNAPQRQNGPTQNNVQPHIMTGLAIVQPPVPPPVAPVAPPPVPPPPVAPPSSSGTSNQPQNGNVRANKKKRRHRR
ncbi:hypothetical protein PYW08_014011 [Mythimna loreyi]|uniref:Uncharacterized protein n=1 Tax=Mythimna loreyi TaxID=667449 RepID=A0ACC2R8W9_9NEOP|nr:hypothetical protein PYW08_014011 [Mythimna loreyi]